MAVSVWFSVLMLSSLQQVFARDCSKLDDIRDSCNECIRCGGIWCTDPNEEIHCSLGTDEWCPLHRTQGVSMPATEEVGSVPEHRHFESSVRVGALDRIVLKYAKEEAACNSKIDTIFVNSTIPRELSGNFVVKALKPKYNGNGECAMVIEAKPKEKFCPPYGISKEFITFRIKVDGVREDATVRYHVPCACDCNENVEKLSEKCNERGDFACGACACHDGWSGVSCEEKPAPSAVPDRGDMPCTNPNTGQICSNNGYCGQYRTCECFYDREGSHYYDEFCDDICTTTGSHDSCLRNPKLGPCNDFQSLKIETYNQSLMGDMYTENRKVWIECNETVDGCVIKYAVRKEGPDGNLHVMVMDDCTPVLAHQVASGVTIIIPAILGLVLLSAVAATAGYLVWKNRSPPLPLTGPQYGNIDAEDCTGENPLYKPPTSSFKNPTYGKW